MIRNLSLPRSRPRPQIPTRVPDRHLSYGRDQTLASLPSKSYAKALIGKHAKPMTAATRSLRFDFFRLFFLSFLSFLSTLGDVGPTARCLELDEGIAAVWEGPAGED